jgi:putative membrane protein
MHNPLDPMVILATLLYTGIGVLVFLGAFVAMVKLAPFSVRKEIEEDQNTALAVLMGSVFLGLALIISAAIRGG